MPPESPQTPVPEPGQPGQPEQPDTPAVSGQPPDAASPASTVSGPSQPPKSSSRLRSVLYTILALAIIGGLGYGAYRVMQSPEQSGNVSKKKDIPVFNLGVVGGTIALYPSEAVDGYSIAVDAQAYEGLVQYRDKTKIVPQLATGWTNPDNSTWDFDLRRNVTFHDGHTMTAKDVVYSLELAMKDETLNSVFANSLKTVKALNNYKVEITTNKPDPFLLNKLTFLMVLENNSPGHEQIKDGTGPFTLKPGTKLTDKKLQLVAYDGYHGGHVSVRALNITEIDSEAAATKALNAGTIDMAGEYDSFADRPTSTSYQKYDIENGVTMLTLNSVAKGPLQDKMVRQALRDSIDTTQLIKDTKTSAQPATQLVDKYIPGYNQSLSLPKRDIVQAKSLLAQAGYPNGVTLKLESVDSNAEVAQNIAKQAKEAGFTINVVLQTDFGTLVDDVIGGKVDTGLISYTSDVLDGSDVFSQVLQQTENYKSDTLDKYLEEAGSTLDQAKRLRTLQDTSKYLNQDVAAIPLFSRASAWYVRNPAYTVDFDSIGSNPGVYFWKVYSTQ